MNATGNRLRRKILIVDDSEDLRELYGLTLGADGHDVQTVALAEEALAVAPRWRPDLVITDLFMPGIGGLELITRLRSDLVPPVPPVLVVSGFPDAKADAMRRGAARFETKPLTGAELRQVVRNVLAIGEPTQGLRPAILEARRAATRAIGEATIERYLTEDPDATRRIGTLSRVAAKFFGHSTVFACFVRGGRCEIVGSSASDPPFLPGADASGIHPILNDVVESASSLVLSNVASRDPLQGVSAGTRFLVAVPYLIDRAVVGAICLVDTVPHAFDSADLGILEAIARRRSSLMTGGGVHILDDSGLVDRDGFNAVLAGSVRSAQDAGHALGFAIFATETMPSDRSLAPLVLNPPGPRFLIGALDRTHVVAFAVAASSDLVRDRLAVTRAELEGRLAVKAIAELTFDDPVPRITPDALSARGQELLACALAERREGEIPFLAVDARRRQRRDERRAR